MNFIIDYLGIIAVILTAIFVYKKFKSGWFVKKETTEEMQDDEQKQSRFQRWWMQSYIREIYVVRASQRKLACAIPWAGVAISAFFVYWFFMGAIDSLIYPHQPFEKLTKYDGTVKGYVYHRKSADILIVQLRNGEIKYFHDVLRTKEIMDTWIDKNITVWVRQEWGVLSGGYEIIQWREWNGKQIDMQAFQKHYQFVREREHGNYPNLLRSLAWLTWFLLLIWIINRNPVEQITTTNNKKQHKG